APKTISNNFFRNWSGGTPPVTLLSVNSGSSSTATINGNTVSAISATTGAVTGLLLPGSRTTHARHDHGNTLRSSGPVAVQGIICTGSTVTLSRNRIYDLSGNNPSPTVNGVLVSTGITTTLQNNLIGDLRAPVANSTTDVVRGISLTSNITPSAI